MQITASNILKMYAGDMQSVTSSSALKPPLDFAESIVGRATSLFDLF
jgi:hypothetical protein